jgi:hypothetical protein
MILKFAKNKEKIKGNFEKLTFTMGSGREQVTHNLHVYDNPPPKPAPEPPEYTIVAPGAVTEGNTLSITVNGVRLPAGVQTIPFAFGGSGIATKDFNPNAALTGNVTFAGLAAQRSDSWTISRQIRSDKSSEGKKGFETITFSVAGKTASIRINDKPPAPTPTPTPVPAPVPMYLNSVVPAAPGRPCVGTKPACTNGSAVISYNLGSVGGSRVTTNHLYVNGKLTASQVVNAASSSFTATGLTAGVAYKFQVINDLKQATVEHTATIPAYV